MGSSYLKTKLLVHSTIKHRPIFHILKQLNMKTIKVVLFALFVLASANLYAQNQAKVVAVVTKADWCQVCQKNGERMMGEVFSSYQDPTQVNIAMNDITDDAKKAESKAALEKLGVYKPLAKEKRTGLITFINPKNGKVLGEISVSESTEAIKKAFDKAIKQS